MLVSEVFCLGLERIEIGLGFGMTENGLFFIQLESVLVSSSVHETSEISASDFSVEALFGHPPQFDLAFEFAPFWGPSPFAGVYVSGFPSRL